MACALYYTIQEGDILSNIANRFNTTVENLLRLNEGLDPDNLPIGEDICIVSKTVQPVSCPYGSLPYNIKPGDTLASIASEFDTTPDALILLNPDIDPYNLQVGSRICIAQRFTPPPDCPTKNYYVIRRGDTLSAIAGIFGVTVREILRINPGLNPNNLTIGQIICIPAAPSPIEIIINVAAKRLTVYRKGIIYREYIVATGRPETPTPLGNFTVVNKETDPGGPYGTRWMGLSKAGYGIHGTNNPASIGTAASNGCIRMYNEDVEALFDITPVGTPVRILP